jgi:hypothetical protein
MGLINEAERMKALGEWATAGTREGTTLSRTVNAGRGIGARLNRIARNPPKGMLVAGAVTAAAAGAFNAHPLRGTMSSLNQELLGDPNASRAFLMAAVNQGAAEALMTPQQRRSLEVVNNQYVGDPTDPYYGTGYVRAQVPFPHPLHPVSSKPGNIILGLHGLR